MKKDALDKLILTDEEEKYWKKKQLIKGFLEDFKKKNISEEDFITGLLTHLEMQFYKPFSKNQIKQIKDSLEFADNEVHHCLRKRTKKLLKTLEVIS